MSGDVDKLGEPIIDIIGSKEFKAPARYQGEVSVWKSHVCRQAGCADPSLC